MTILGAILFVLLALPLSAWTAGALYYDLARATTLGRVLGVAWVLAALAISILLPIWIALLLVLSLNAAVLAWWVRIPPTHDRDWRPELAVMPTAELTRGTVTIRNTRHAVYNSLDDITPRYTDRAFDLAGLRAMDIAVGNWGSIFMAHPFAIFEFEPDTPGAEPQRIGFSLEVRNTRGQGFSLFRNLYRQNELICVAADERDLIRRRVEHEERTLIYLYRLRLRPETIRMRFLEYIDTINSLAQEPRWYNGITTNCTTGVFRTYRGNKPPFDWRVVVNGQLDAYLYKLGLLDTSLPFDELKQQSIINSIARGHPDEGFGEAIRRGRPGFDTAAEADTANNDTAATE